MKEQEVKRINRRIKKAQRRIEAGYKPTKGQESEQARLKRLSALLS